jgi:integrase/recombinase XerC
LAEQSERRLVEVMLRFLRFVDRAFGVVCLCDVTAEHVAQFLSAPSGAERRSPSVATSHLRRSAVRLLFRVLRGHGVVEHDPTLDLQLPPRSSLSARPLLDDEIALGRSFSFRTLSETRQPAAWALAEATARTSELSTVKVGDVDLDSAQVWIAGGTKTVPRWGALSDWGVDALARRIQTLGDEATPAMPLVYEGRGSLESRQASACAAVGETLRRAGLAGERDVRPVSVAAWAGLKVLDVSGRIELVAQALGVRSLDRAAKLIGWDWSICGQGDR